MTFKSGDRRIRLRADYGTDEFWSHYHAAVKASSRPRAARQLTGSLAWLIERYRETGAWMDLSPATRRNRENHFKQVIKTAGERPAQPWTLLQLSKF